MLQAIQVRKLLREIANLIAGKTRRWVGFKDMGFGDRDVTLYRTTIDAGDRMFLLLTAYQLSWGNWSVRLELQQSGDREVVPLQAWCLQAIDPETMLCPKCLQDCDGETCPVDIPCQQADGWNCRFALFDAVLEHLLSASSPSPVAT